MINSDITERKNRALNNQTSISYSHRSVNCAQSKVLNLSPIILNQTRHKCGF